MLHILVDKSSKETALPSGDPNSKQQCRYVGWAEELVIALRGVEAEAIDLNIVNKTSAVAKQTVWGVQDFVEEHHALYRHY